MPAQAVTLQLPEPLYDHFKRRADDAHRSVEVELLEAVATAVPRSEELPVDLAVAVADLAGLDDDALWRAAKDRFPEKAAAELEALNLKQQREGLERAEKKRQSQLLKGYERVMLLRSEAAWLLKQRGHDVAGLIRKR